MGFTVAIVGRPNVGKSTFFNRMLGLRKAIVDDTSGVTRDRQYGVSEWNGKEFNLIDTGGFVLHSDDKFEAAIREQVKIAVNEANMLLFMMDVTTGITDLDQDMAEMLRKSGKPVVIIVNKVDNTQREIDVAEFYSLGFEHVYPVSSISGRGTGELLDIVAEHVKEDTKVEKDDEIPDIAIIGQPNVGKSSLLNAFLGEDRNIVTDIAGTTRDTIHTRYKLFGNNVNLIDTAGIRKKSKVHENLEFYSVIRAIKAIESADVCIIMVDATLGIESQDVSLISLAIRKKKGIVLVVNKWDLIEKTTQTSKVFEADIRQRTSPFVDYPILFVSVLQKQRILKVLETAAEVFERRKTRISTSRLNKFLEEVISQKKPPAYKGKFIKIKYITQLPTKTPAFAFFCNFPKYIRDDYKQYLENQLRKNFNLSGVPISLVFREK